MFISVYAIAKNEAKVAERWYECFKEADEVVVLVNNSTDETASILRRLGAKVIEKTYEHFRFDIARNESMSLCSSKADLLFAVDLDDTIEHGWREKIEKAWDLGLKSGGEPNAILYTYVVRWASGDQRFIRHGLHTPNGWYWKSRIHEYLEHKTHKNFLYYPKFELVNIAEIKDHSSYLPLLEEEARSNECEPRTLHLLGREYLLNKKFTQALQVFNRYLSDIGSTWAAERAATMKFMADCYAGLGDATSQELWLWKAMVEDPKDRDAPYLLGKLLIIKKEYHLAVEVLQRCLEIKEPQLDYPFFALASWTEHPWLCLGEAYYYSGKWDDAQKAISKGLEMNPDSSLGKQMLKDIQRNRTITTPPSLPVEVPRKRIEIAELEN